MDSAKLSLDNTLGAMYLAAVIGGCMYGVTTLQTYTYFGRYSSDNMYLKSLIFFLWIIDTIHAALVTRSMYTYLVTDFTDILAVVRPTWTLFPATLVLTRVIHRSRSLHWPSIDMRATQRTVSQNMALGRNWYLALAIALSVLTTFGASMALAILGAHLPSWFDLHKFAWLLILALSWSIAADVLIAAALCVLLIRKRTGFQRSDTILRRLVIYSVNTGVLSSMCALACVITYTTMPDNFIFMAFYCSYPKMILNCLLATLNGRAGLRNMTALHGTDSSSELARPRRMRHGRRTRSMDPYGDKAGLDMVIDIGFTGSAEENTGPGWLGGQANIEVAQRPGSKAIESDSIRQRIISSVFTKLNGETYAGHIKIWEEAPADEGGKKPRYIILSQANDSQGFIHKSKLNANGSFSVGKTWRLNELRGIEVLNPLAFNITMSRTYRWQTENQTDQSNFLSSLVQLFRIVTGGNAPLELIGVREPAEASSRPPPLTFSRMERAPTPTGGVPLPPASPRRPIANGYAESPQRNGRASAVSSYAPATPGPRLRLREQVA
ncbi:hypothetical protein NUW54_g3220 [Trametes sanguinea]|uniref:Uncharacterized protein n=1 Tax=Trametes sanguinea TaxID=158606 RepID=A0ACC1Q4J2_9APHY|nr:hypothetical protein NUW54_g3220 [Trametes sanguinea]